ncbi:MAG: radical SAM protein [Planctomycetota bacterium]
MRTLRINVTDRGGFQSPRVAPFDEPSPYPSSSLLSFEEIASVARAAITHGITAFKITGGEPLARHDLPRLISMLAGLPGTRDLSMTTDGTLLTQHAEALKLAGLNRISVRLDSLDRKKYKIITRGGNLDQVWRGIDAAEAAGFDCLKLNVHAMHGINEGEIPAFAALTLRTGLTVRFVEYVPCEGDPLRGRHPDHFISERDLRRAITRRHGPLVPAPSDAGFGPAILWRLQDAPGKIGFISAVSDPFCKGCNRLRLTPQGRLRSCRFDGTDVELRSILRQPAALTPGHEVAAQLHDAFLECVGE